MSEPAYTRLDVDERRRRLLELGADLFARHSYDELSMAAIAREAGISKALLYHYFPSKQAYFGAALGRAPAELVAVVDARARRRAAEQLDAFLGWVEDERRRLREARAQRRRRARGARAHGRVRDRHRRADPRRACPAAPTPERRVAVSAWLWFMDGAILDWLEHRDLDRAALRALLLRALEGALGEPL